jgi:hypothetical protein
MDPKYERALHQQQNRKPISFGVSHDFDAMLMDLIDDVQHEGVAIEEIISTLDAKAEELREREGERQ